MPEPSDRLSERLAAAPGLATLLAEAQATWLARADRDVVAAGGDAAAAAAAGAEGVDAQGDRTTAGRPDSADSVPGAAVVRDGSSAAGARPVTARWRAFEDAFPTFYQFTNRPRA